MLTRSLSSSHWLLIAVALALLVPRVGEAKSLRRLARCISDSGATFYGAHWCPYCAKQKDIFGAAESSLPYVECYKPGTRDKRRKCRDVRSFPTWEFADGTVRTGALSAETLAALTGCEAP